MAAGRRRDQPQLRRPWAARRFSVLRATIDHLVSRKETELNSFFDAVDRGLRGLVNDVGSDEG
jgi:hypothetical protein